MRALADETGGETIVDSNNFTPLFQGFVRDNSAYYLLGYDPVVEHRDGKFHKLTVRVKNRPELTVRARSGYYAPEPDAKAKPRPPVADGLSVETADAVRMPSSVGDLGIDLFAAPFKGDGLTGSVLLGAQLRGADLVLGGERAHRDRVPGDDDGGDDHAGGVQGVHAGLQAGVARGRDAHGPARDRPDRAAARGGIRCGSPCISRTARRDRSSRMSRFPTTRRRSHSAAS